MTRSIFTYLSIFFLILTFFMYGYSLELLFKISIFTPFVISVLGIVCAILGIKGTTRMIFIVLHSFTLLISLFVFVAGFYGFNEP